MKTFVKRIEKSNYAIAGNCINALEESNLSSQGRGRMQNSRVKVLEDKRAGKDGQPQSQVFSYQYDALDRRIAKTDSFGTTVFTWEGMRLLQESRGQQTSTYIYEPGSY
ncbi:MAG: hypothetical protein EOO88_53950, partial [Pedobacter sp.]